MKKTLGGQDKPAGTIGRALRRCVAAGLIGIVQAAHDAPANGPVMITPAVSSSCAVGASPLEFGNVSSAAISAVNVDTTATVTIECTSGSAFTIGLGPGTGSGASVAIRKMSAGAQLLSYSIYTTTARAMVWGDGTGSNAMVFVIGTGSRQSVIAYGRIFAWQVVTAATYSDTVTVNISH